MLLQNTPHNFPVIRADINARRLRSSFSVMFFSTTKFVDGGTAAE